MAETENARDSRGRFTPEYNTELRSGVEPGETDRRWAPDVEKRRARDLSTLSTPQLRPSTLARKLLAMGVNPLLSERRGFDGLDGPSGEWLGLLGGTAYMPATLDKALAELALLDVESGLWDAHAAQWHRISSAWSVGGPDWLRTILYIDGTADPYWTRAFARSGKVSKTGRVMPCLSD